MPCRRSRTCRSTSIAGEVHGLVGENGAGKSTLVKILAGVHPPDAGSILVQGKQVFLDGPADARDAGIAIIYQEPILFPDLTVEENIFIGRQPLTTGRRIDRHGMRAHVTEVFERLGVHLDPGRIARGLSIAEQQIVEIGKALSLDAKIIVMDEPTAALSAVEVARLFGVVDSLRAAGAAVLFISHRLEEIFQLCQRVTVLRDGRWILSQELEGLTADDLVRAMVGREIVERESEQQAVGATVLHVERLTREGFFTDVSFEVKAGEIVALAGLVGAGRSEVARAIFGIDRYDAGAVTVGGRELRRASPTAAMSAGVGLVPEDRRQQGLVMDLSISRNVALASLGRLQRFGFILSASRAALRRRLGGAAQPQVRPARERRQLALGREPAEGRARQVARPRAEAADRRRADTRHRRRHEGRGPSPARRAREPAAWPC